MDYQSLLYDPIYSTTAVAGTITFEDSTPPMDVSVIDKTTGVDIGDTVQEQVIVPAATMRVKEVLDKGLSEFSQLLGATIAFNNKSWSIESYRLLPSPNGERDGEVFIILEEASSA